MPRGKYIAIAGNIGAGKTELTEFLCRRYGLEPFYEPNEANPYLADFYADMRSWALQSQLFFLAHKCRLHQQLQGRDKAVIQDRTIYEDAEIFARNLHLQRLMSKRDFDTYWTLYEGLRLALRPPDLMIQLRCPVRTLRQRIRQRGRAYEQDMPARYLTKLNHLYEDWFRRYDLSPVLVLDTDRLDYLTDLVDRVDLLERIEHHLGG